jgi:phosphatidate cytidylyltransferase
MQRQQSGNRFLKQLSQSMRVITGELVSRIISALFLIVVAIAVSWIGGLWFQIFCAVGATLILYEFFGICSRKISRSTIILAWAAFASVLLCWFLVSVFAAMLLALVIFILLMALELLEKKNFWAASGLGYALLPFFALTLLRGEHPDGFQVVILLFGAVWGADTMAYFTGRKLGGPKLAPGISPGKTWSGVFGGLAGAVAAVAAIAALMGYQPGIIVIAVAILLGLVSVAGDLFESWIKRRFDKKDSGNSIPGHGGLMDRIDGLVFAAIAAWLIGWIYGGRLLVPGDTATAFVRAILLP